MANRYLVPGGTGDYDSTTNWSTTSGGASGASKPVAADAIIIDANSLNTPLTVSTPNDCLSFTASNYTGVVTINNTLQTNGTLATGNITLSAGMTITGTGTFAKKGTSTTGAIISNGAIFDCHFSFTNTVACTTSITGTMQVNGNLSSTLSSTTVTTINLGTIKVGGNIIHNNPFSGSTVLEMIGANPATITQVATRYLGTSLIINKAAGAFNQVDLYWGASGRTLTYTSGLFSHTGILFTTINATLNTSAITWNIIQPAGGTLNFTSICFADKIQQSSGVANSLTFGGTFGFNINYLAVTTSNTGTVRFASGKTYTINTSLIYTAVSNPATFQCVSGANAIIALGENAFMKLYKINISRITASNKTLRTVDGTVDAGVSKNVFKLDSNLNAHSVTR